MSKVSIAILGNSGLACIKKAWDESFEKDNSNFKLTFFGSSAYTIQCLELKNNQLIPSDPKVEGQFFLTSNGENKIDIQNFDIFILYGISLEHRDYLRIFHSHCLYNDRSYAKGRNLISIECLDQAVNDLTKLRPGVKIGNFINTACSSPIILVPGACPSEIILDNYQFKNFKYSINDGFTDVIYNRYVDSVNNLAQTFKWNTIFQDKKTMSHLGFTAKCYSAGAVGLPQNYKKAIENEKWYRDTRQDDPWHMNTDFGNILLKQILHFVNTLA